MLDILTKQVASPVQFVTGLKTLYGAGARIFVEVGPKKALQGFAEDVLGSDSEVISIFTNHPKVGDVVAFNQALCALYAAGLGTGHDGGVGHEIRNRDVSTTQPVAGSTPQAHSERGSATSLFRTWTVICGPGGSRLGTAAWRTPCPCEIKRSDHGSGTGTAGHGSYFR